MTHYFPIFGWGKEYNRQTFTSDLLAALIVTVMLIPQSLAYALLAGLAPEVGLYASIAPLVLYAVLGTSRALAVGPVAVVSLMTAAAVGEIASQGTPEYLAAAIIMAFASGLILLSMGLFRLGFIASFLSHPVISGFISASGLLIALGQLPTLMGIKAPGHTAPEILHGIALQMLNINVTTVVLGILATAFLWWSRSRLGAGLRKFGVSAGLASIIVRAAPITAVAVSTLVAYLFDFEMKNVSLVGDIPSGMPALTLPSLDFEVWKMILIPALIISVVGYVETISVAQTLAAKRRQRIDPNQELIALGAANIGAGMAGGFPVTGGFARSVVNFDAGAQTPAAGAFTAVGMALATLYLTPLLAFLPKATLAATIIVAVLGLVDLGALRRIWKISRADAAAMAMTITLTLLAGVETGIAVGVALSFVLHLWRTSRPHMAVIGQVPGSEHYRNVNRHNVITVPEVLSIRIDEALYFPNMRWIEDTISAKIAHDTKIKHLVLNCVAINDMDSSAIEALEAINMRLKESNVSLHLAEVKGPLMDRLRRTDLLDHLGGKVYLTQFDALHALAPEVTEATRALARCETAKSI